MTPIEQARAPVPGVVGRWLSALYLAVINRRNARFDRGVGVVDLGVPVVSVGNLSVGGTGKTPMVAHVVDHLRGLGLRPLIAMRGYKSGDHGSDEAREYERRVPGVPIVARPDRVAGIRAARDAGAGFDCVVLDDGFQHRRIRRDLDIVLVDSTRSPFEDRPLPAGYLREPVSSLERAQAVVITHADRVDDRQVGELREQIARFSPGALIAVCEHAWGGWGGADGSVLPGEALRGRRVVAACAIGNPGAFMAQLDEHADVLDRVVLRDHDPFGPAVVQRIRDAAGRADASFIVVTDKDWTKLADLPVDGWPCPVVRPVLRLRFRSGGEGLLEAARRATGGLSTYSQG